MTGYVFTWNLKSLQTTCKTGKGCKDQNGKKIVRKVVDITLTSNFNP